MAINILVFALVVILLVALGVYAVRHFMPGDPKLKQLAQFIIVIIGILAIATRII